MTISVLVLRVLKWLEFPSVSYMCIYIPARAWGKYIYLYMTRIRTPATSVARHVKTNVVFKLLRTLCLLKISEPSVSLYVCVVRGVPFSWNLSTQSINSVLLLRKLSIHQRYHKGLPLNPVLNQLKPVHIISTYFSEIHSGTVSSSHFCLGPSSGLFRRDSQHKFYMYFSMLCVCAANPIILVT
jgi:hypothetical protein